MVWEWEERKAGRIYVQIVDAITENPVFNASFVLQEPNDTLFSDGTGWVRWGNLNGTFEAVIEASNYFTDTLSFEITEEIDDSLRIYLEPIVVSTKKEETSIFQVFPNPAKDYIQLTTPKEGFIKLYTLDGQLIYQKTVQAGNTEIDTTPFAAGVYFLSFEYDNHQQSLRLLLK